jgi:hypothetical protein
MMAVVPNYLASILPRWRATFADHVRRLHAVGVGPVVARQALHTMIVWEAGRMNYHDAELFVQAAGQALDEALSEVTGSETATGIRSEEGGIRQAGARDCLPPG